MKTETQIIAIGLDVLALNIPDGSNCKLIKAASDKLIELESENEALKYLDDEASHGASAITDKYQKAVKHLESIAFAKYYMNRQDLSDKAMNALVALGEYKRVTEPANEKGQR